VLVAARLGGWHRLMRTLGRRAKPERGSSRRVPARRQEGPPGVAERARRRASLSPRRRHERPWAFGRAGRYL